MNETFSVIFKHRFIGLYLSDGWSQLIFVYQKQFRFITGLFVLLSHLDTRISGSSSWLIVASKALVSKHLSFLVSQINKMNDLKTHGVWKSKKVSFSIASEASYGYILSGQKFIKNAKKWFLKTWSLRSILIQKAQGKIRKNTLQNEQNNSWKFVYIKVNLTNF